MYNPGADYLSYKEHNTAIRKPRSKIVVDGVTYTGLEHLVTFPKITHETDKMIGGFPAKTCEFEIYNLDGSLNLNGKEVQVYRGLDISDEKTVWVPMGLFFADGEDVVNNSTKRTIQFKGTDRTRLFDSPFKNAYANGVIPKNTSLLNIAIKICAAHKLTIDPSTKNNILSYTLKNDAGTPDGTTDRQVIAWIAELSGCIPIISRDGKYLVFTRPKYTERVSISGQVYNTGSYAQKTRYKSLTVEPKFGAINSISFGHADYDDAYVYQDEDIDPDNICEWPINDNALAENEKEDIAPLVYSKIKGMSIVPFTLTDFIDDFLFDINDGILIQKKDGTTFISYILGMSTSSRIRSAFKTGVQDTTAADRSLAGSVKNDIKKVKLSVDHVKNEITALAQDTDGKYTELKLTYETIDAKIEDPKNGLKAQLTATAAEAKSQYEALEKKVEKDFVSNAAYNSYIEQTAKEIKINTDSIKKIQNAGYITETEARSMIDLQDEKITLSVEKNLKIGARNILLDSACFASLPVAGRSSTIPTITLYEDTAVPSGVFKDIVFTPNRDGNLNSNGTCSNSRGFYFTSASLLGQIYRKAEYTLTSDTEVEEYKRYYTRSGSDGSYVYSYVENPIKDDLATYYELTQEPQSIDKLKPNTTYALSWWMRWGYSIPKPEDFKFNDVFYFGDGNNAKYITDKCIFPGFDPSWQRYVIIFTTPAKITNFWLRFFFGETSPDIGYSVHISSLKLEEGNIATDWTPSETDLVSNATYNSFIELLPQKITLGVSETVTDDYIADKIHSKCVSVELDINGFTINNGAFVLKDGEGEIMIDSTGIHSEYLNFGKTIDMETIKNGNVIDTNDVDIWTLRNYTGSETGMVNAKAAVSIMSNIPALKTLFWNNSNNWFCHNSSTNSVTIANIDSVEETQTYILTFDYIGATTTNGKGLIPQVITLTSDKSMSYEVGTDNLISGSATVNGNTYQYRYGTLSCSVRGYDLIKLRGGRSNNAVLSVGIRPPSAGWGVDHMSNYWYLALFSPTTDNMAFIGNIKLKTFVGATLNARALLNSNTDYFFDLGTGILSADEIGCKNLRAVSIPTSTATDTLKKLYIDETTGQLYRDI